MHALEYRRDDDTHFLSANFSALQLPYPTTTPYTALMSTMYSHVSTTHCSSALPTPPPSLPTPWDPESSALWAPAPGMSAWRIRYVASMRKGKPKPSLAPASDEMISRRWRATYLSAKGPLAMACDRMGSVQVTQDPMTRAASCDGRNQ